MTKKLYIKTYGCQMNVYDSERMVEALGAADYTETPTPDDADMILLNTCHIREKAAEKVYSELGRYKSLKAANPDLKIGVAGCVAQAEGEEIMRRQPMVDLVVGPQSYHRLPELLAEARRAGSAIDQDFEADGGLVGSMQARVEGLAGAAVDLARALAWLRSARGDRLSS